MRRDTDSSASDEEIESLQYKVVILGDGTVGKTSITQRFTADNFAQSYKQTIGVDFFIKRVVLPGNIHVTLQLWDIGGQQLGSKMLSRYIYGSQCIILAYDITNYESFKNLTDWLSYAREVFQETMPLLVVMGNKIDLNHMRAIRAEAHEDFVNSNNTLSFFVSAKNGDNINTAFKRIAASLSGVTLTRRDVEQEAKVISATIVNHPNPPGKKNVQKKNKICTVQ